METLTTAEAAAHLEVNVPKFFRLAIKHEVLPVFEAPGKRGAKFWNPRDVERLAALVTERLAS